MEPAISCGASSRLLLATFAATHSVKVAVNSEARRFFSPLHEDSTEHCVHVVGVRRHDDVQELDEGGGGGNLGEGGFGGGGGGGEGGWGVRD